MTDANFDAQVHLLAGVEAFNAGDYYSAHDLWEVAWRHGPIEQKRFFHSLIQGAVALYHWENGNTASANRMFAAGLKKAHDCPPRCLGVNLPAFWEAIAAVMESPLLGSGSPISIPVPKPTISLMSSDPGIRDEADHD